MATLPLLLIVAFAAVAITITFIRFTKKKSVSGARKLPGPKGTTCSVMVTLIFHFIFIVISIEMVLADTS